MVSSVTVLSSSLQKLLISYYMLKLIFQTFPGSRTPFNLRRTHLLKETGKCFENEKKKQKQNKTKKTKKPESPWRINKQFKYKSCVLWLEDIHNLTSVFKIDRSSKSLFLSFFLTKYIIKNVMEYNNWWLIFPCSKILWFSVPLRMTLLLSKVSLQFFDT